MGWRKVLGQIVEDAELLACHLAGRTPDRNIQTPEEVEATMKMVELAMHRCLPKRLRTMPSAFLQMPPADRIALARELLAGTGRVVVKAVENPATWPNGCCHPNSCARHRDCMYLGCEHRGFDIGPQIDACRAAMLADDAGDG